MRKIFLLLLINYSINITAQNNDYAISFDGIGPLKLGMKQNEVEKVINKKILLTNLSDTISGSWQDSAKIKFKNADLLLHFQRLYIDDKKFDMELIGIQIINAVFKTAAGISIGADRLKLLSAYEEYELCAVPDFANDNPDSIKKSKINSTITVKNDDGNRVMIFLLKNKKVVSVETAVYFHDGE